MILMQEKIVFNYGIPLEDPNKLFLF